MKRGLIKFFSVLALSLLGVPGTSLALPLTAPPTNLYVLGDSLSDVGNLFLATGGAIDPANALPQPADYFQGRFSNGPVYVEYLAANLGLPLASIPSLAGGTNYAFGGARSHYHAVDVANGFDPLAGGFDPLTGTSSVLPFTLLGQRDAFLAQLGPALDPGALYTVWIGSNDVGDAIALAASAGQTAALALLAQSASDLLSVIGTLVTAGAQDLLIPKVPNLGLVPEVLALEQLFPGAQALATQLSQLFNASVDAGLAGIGANIIRFDTFQFLTDAVADPTQFGLPASVNTTDPCFTGFVGVPGTSCIDPESRLFWDEIHPSALAHQALGAAVTAAVVPEPAAIALIALALATLAVQRRRLGRLAP